MGNKKNSKSLAFQLNKKNNPVEYCTIVMYPVMMISFFGRPGWRSLLAKYDLSGSEPPTILGSDKLVKLLRLHPGLVVGIWRVRFLQFPISASIIISILAYNNYAFSDVIEKTQSYNV